ncbi:MULTISPECIES: hypothetical protein [Calothrix]|nr:MULTISPECIES: hypothetical protein [Calothrix]
MESLAKILIFAFFFARQLLQVGRAAQRTGLSLRLCVSFAND